MLYNRKNINYDGGSKLWWRFWLVYLLVIDYFIIILSYNKGGPVVLKSNNIFYLNGIIR